MILTYIEPSSSQTVLSELLTDARCPKYAQCGATSQSSAFSLHSVHTSLLIFQRRLRTWSHPLVRAEAARHRLQMVVQDLGKAEIGDLDAEVVINQQIPCEPATGDTPVTPRCLVNNK